MPTSSAQRAYKLVCEAQMHDRYSEGCAKAKHHASRAEECRMQAERELLHVPCARLDWEPPLPTVAVAGYILAKAPGRKRDAPGQLSIEQGVI